MSKPFGDVSYGSGSRVYIFQYAPGCLSFLSLLAHFDDFLWEMLLHKLYYMAYPFQCNIYTFAL